MFQDWTWQCGGCKKLIEPYESHDMVKCYEENNVQPYQAPPTHWADALGAIVLLGMWIFCIYALFVLL